jgi:hypothetical protein
LEKGVLLIEVHTLPQSGILHVVYNEISIDLHSWLRIFFFADTFQAFRRKCTMYPLIPNEISRTAVHLSCCGTLKSRNHVATDFRWSKEGYHLLSKPVHHTSDNNCFKLLQSWLYVTRFRVCKNGEHPGKS